MKNLTRVLLVVILSANTLLASSGKASHFLATGPGSASQALGEAVVSRGVDSGAAFYNPATLIGFPSSVMFEYAQPNDGATRNWLGFCIGSSNRMKVGGAWKQETLPLNSNKNAFMLSAGISDKLLPYAPKGFNIGISLGYVSETISNYSATAMLGSMGASYSKKSGPWLLGFGGMLKNLYFSGLKFREDGEKEVWPIEPELGAFISRWGLTFMTSYRSGSATPTSVGLSYSPIKYIDLRVGMNGSPRMGIGIEVKKFRIEYAMVMGVLKNSNSMTLQYLWGKEEEKRDYTDPYQELSAKYDSLPESVLAKINSDVNRGRPPDIHDVLRLLVSNLKSEEGWSFWQDMTGQPKIHCRIPWGKKAKRAYWEFAVSYVDESREATNLARQFVSRFSGESICKLVREILVRDLLDEKEAEEFMKSGR